MLIGILGGGQLGRMLALAGYPLGFRFRFLDPAPDAPAGHVGELITGDFDDPAALDRFSRGLDAATFEFENVPALILRRLAERIPTFPPPKALEIGQDRLAEKTLFRSLGLDMHDFAPAATRQEFEAALARVGLPAVVKTRRFGYDGKGQAIVREPDDADRVWEQLGRDPLLVEAFVPFSRECSVIAARGRGGETRVYPLIENAHRAGILRRSVAPAPGVTPAIQSRAESHARAILHELDYVGILAIEFFVVERPGEGTRLLANEMAPRVHNSGHWTTEGAVTGQFENHLRAVAGLPLGDPSPRGHSVMLNLIGAWPDPAAVLRVPGAHLHLYGKSPRPGRKVGHITVTSDTPADAAAHAATIETLLPS